MPGFNLYEDSFTEKLRPLVNVIHEGGAKAFAQLIHQGRYAKTRDYIDGVQAVAPSAIFTRMTGETPRELTVGEILYLENAFAEAARRAVEAGFDGIEICANSGYLFGQFLSPLTNIRADQYGGIWRTVHVFLQKPLQLYGKRWVRMFLLLYVLGAVTLLQEATPTKRHVRYQS